MNRGSTGQPSTWIGNAMSGARLYARRHDDGSIDRAPPVAVR
ncbi:hypothetical protein ACIPQC_18600 [[Kitasatospora] papulosa]